MAIIGFLVFGLVVGAVARLIKPGRQHLSILMTLLLGVVGSIIGGVVASAARHRQHLRAEHPRCDRRDRGRRAADRCGRGHSAGPHARLTQAPMADCLFCDIVGGRRRRGRGPRDRALGRLPRPPAAVQGPRPAGAAPARRHAARPARRAPRPVPGGRPAAGRRDGRRPGRPGLVRGDEQHRQPERRRTCTCTWCRAPRATACAASSGPAPSTSDAEGGRLRRAAAGRPGGSPARDPLVGGARRAPGWSTRCSAPTRWAGSGPGPAPA